MVIELQLRNGIFILRCLGRLATGTDTAYLDSRLEEIRSLAGCKVLADFREVTSIGSTGVGFLISVFQCITERPTGLFVIAAANARVRRVFEITHLTRLIPLASDVESALAALRAVSGGLQSRRAACPEMSL